MLALGSGSGNGLKELGVKVREGLREKWATLTDAAGVRRNEDARKAIILKRRRAGKRQSPGPFDDSRSQFLYILKEKRFRTSRSS